MKFLAKNPDSPIFSHGMKYLENRSVSNKALHDELLKEQHNFCAYTERYILPTDATEVEHLNSSIKYEDDYFNYYVVKRKANLWKMAQDKKYQNASFHENHFFQNKQQLNARIKFEDGQYPAIEDLDIEATNFIEFIGMNHPDLFGERLSHINRLKNLFSDNGFDDEKKRQMFREEMRQLDFITAIEVEFNLNLSEFYVP